MASQASATLDANDEVCGPIIVAPKHKGRFAIEITGTITVTLKAKMGGTGFITLKQPDGSTDAAYTASVIGVLEAGAEYQLVASGVSGGSAVCFIGQE